MALFEWTLVLLLGAVILAGMARRIGVPYPALLSLAGAGLAFLPFAEGIEIDPGLALALFVAPVLLDAAFDTSPRELKHYAVPVALLALAAVIVTTLVVALIGVKLAGLPLAAAITLGAIVAPPDAAAAAAVLGELRPSRRIMAIVQGESLLNDATALLIYRVGVAATLGAALTAAATPWLALSLAASVAAGYVLGKLYVLATRRVTDPASATVLQFVGVFGVWLLADRVGLSAIITMVVYAMTLARYAPRRTAARNRVSSYSVWETAVFVLNVLAFVLMGLQARPILERLSAEHRLDALMLSAAVLAAVIAVRILWVLGCGALIRALFGPREDGDGIRSDIVVGWCGMRGLVTLATAFALPDAFPGRDLVVLTAFSIVLGTLVLQGATLKPLLRLLRFEPDRSVELEVSRARIAVVQAAIDALDGDTSPVAIAVREQYAAELTVAGNPDAPQAATPYDDLRLRAIKKQRDALHRLRASGAISDEAFHRLEEEIDWAELDAAPAGRFQPLTT